MARHRAHPPLTLHQERPTLHRALHRTLPLWQLQPQLRLSVLAGALCLVACGGGNTVDEPASFKLLPDDLVGAPCAGCREGFLIGQAHDGVALADADVLLIDAQGQTAQGRTDAQGRYAIATTGLSGALLVQVNGLSSGEPVQLHSLAVAVDVGNRAVHVSPLTELMAAFVLGGAPQDLLQQGRIDFMRINATSLRSGQDRVRHLVQSSWAVIAGASAAAPDLRNGEQGPAHRGMGALASLIELQRVASAYRLSGVAGDAAAQAGVQVDPVASSVDAVLPAPSTAQATALQAGLAALPDLEQSLARFSQLLQSGQAPNAPELQAWLAPEFRHTGLDAAAFIDQVLLQTDPGEAPGSSLRGVRFERPRLVQVDSADRLRVRVQLSLPAPALPRSETLWMRKVGDRWLWEGDGQTGLVRLRHLSILGPKPREAADLLALPGMRCAASGAADTRCAVEGGQGDAPSGGQLDYGSPQGEQFGLLAHYRSEAGSWQERLQMARQRTRLLATPSAQVSQHLAFEVDARRIDPRVSQVRVQGTGLPEQGLSLVRPAEGQGFEQMTLADSPEQDWHALRTDRCPGSGSSAAEHTVCQANWAKAQVGEVYRFSFFDAQGRLLQTQTARLPAPPAPAAQLQAQASQWFARFDLQAEPAQQPLYARVLDPERRQQALDYRWAWQAPKGASQQLVGAKLELHWGHPETGAQGQLQLPLSARSLHAAGSHLLPAQLLPTAALPTGALPVWLSARLSSRDAQGNLYMHYIAPNNPF